ncbi:hypothetical protein [Shewanella sp. SM21]|uniref:hypothetical protein n=1 Tax=Shewanella sp. SM21 TaxID=2912793 RepID=UPI0021DA8CE9|nr:hypothetical protein [Shewanella sp. SM21]MCU8089789.1 hypothetical protein [Shewanella sp. SM21]
MKYNFHMDVYDKNLKLTYDPETSILDKKEVLNYFLAYKAEIINSNDCPKEVTDAIQHLKEQTIPYNKGDESSWQNNKKVFFIMSIAIGITVLFIWHLILPHLNEVVL